MKTGNENCKHLMNLVKINHSFIPLVQKKRFQNIKTTGSFGGKSCRIKHTKIFFFKNHALLVDKPICDQSKYTAEHKYKIYWSNKLIQVSNSSTELPATGGR